jgi:23S rRNA pseudouridine2605 synthase
MDEPVRLQKAISSAGLMSRRAAEQLIGAGRVTIDGRVAILGDRVDPAGAVVAIDGNQIPIAPGLVSYLVYKPPGVVSTASDPEGRQTVVDLVPAEPRVWPVGRLDVDSEGLILLSNDGILTNLVTHPRHRIHKTYQVLFEGNPGSAAIRRLLEGVELEDGPARAVSARIIDRSRGLVLVEMVMGEGRNREIRRMGTAIGCPVARLVRIGIGPLSDRSLRPGKWRALSVEEVASLYRAAHLEADSDSTTP